MWLLFGWGVLFLFVDDAEEFSESEALPAEEDEYDDVFLVSGVLLRNSERFSDKPVFDLYDVPLFNFLGLVTSDELTLLTLLLSDDKYSFRLVCFVEDTPVLLF